MYLTSELLVKVSWDIEYLIFKRLDLDFLDLKGIYFKVKLNFTIKKLS